MTTTTSPSVRVTKLTQHPEGFYTANVSLNGETVAVDNKLGSWVAHVRKAPHSQTFVMKGLSAAVAAELQARLPAVERKVGGKRES